MIFHGPHVSSAIYVDTKVCSTLLIIEITSLEKESMQIALPTALKFYDFDFSFIFPCPYSPSSEKNLSFIVHKTLL